MNTSADIIMGAEAVNVPPSPGLQNQLFSDLDAQSGTRAKPDRKLSTLSKDRTGAGIKKQQQQQAKIKGSFKKLVHATVTLSISTVDKPFRFMDLPGGKSFL